MKILYGVVGEGMGHAIRSSVILEKLIADGHEVHVVVSGRAYDFLKARFPQVSQIWGLTMAYVDNELRNTLTFTKNLKGALRGWPANIKRYFEVEAEFQPDVVISDFETWTWMFAKRHRLPLFCLDNIQIINRCKHTPEVLGDMKNFKIVRSVVTAKCPNADHYLITTFFYPPIRKKRTTLVPPILRDSILEAEPSQGEHLLVYQTSSNFLALPEVLKKVDRPVYIYGLRKDITEDIADGNLLFRPFSETQFIEDLATCAGVVASAGFTLLGEALHLGKPYLATPVRKQFEQILNANYLEHLGYGMSRLDLDLADIDEFITRIPEFTENLKGYTRQDNSHTFKQLDMLLESVAAGKK